MKKLSVVLVIVLLFAIVLSACGASGKPIDLLKAYAGFAPYTLDPAEEYADYEGTYMLHLFEGLYSLDESGDPVPAQAQSCDISKDGLTYTFKLRDGIKWGDGEAVTAGDFVYAWSRIASAPLVPETGELFSNIEGYDGGYLNVIAEDDQTLVVHLSRPNAAFLRTLTEPCFFPVREDIVETHGDNWSLQPQSCIGNGPYYMRELDDDFLILERSSSYWNHKNVTVKAIEFTLSDDASQPYYAFRAGDLQYNGYLLDDVLAEEAAYDTLGSYPSLYTAAVIFNHNSTVFSNKTIRQAVTLAMDREALATGSRTAAGGLVPNGYSGIKSGSSFRDNAGNFVSISGNGAANLNEAKALLSDTGYPNGAGIPSVTYLTYDSAAQDEITAAVQTALAELGIGVEIKTAMTYVSFLESRRQGDFDLAAWTHEGLSDDPMRLLEQFVTSTPENHTEWYSDAYADAVSAAETSMSESDYKKNLHKAEELLMQDWVLSPLYFHTSYYLQDTSIQGVRHSPSGLTNFAYATMKK